MACTGCAGTTPQSFATFFSNSPCNSAGCTDCQQADASCVFYTGTPGPCSGIQTNDNLEVALQKIDEKLCQTLGDFSGYNFNCLTAWVGNTITNQAQFVDAITAYACQITTALNSFINITYSAYIGATDDRLDNLENPNITCTSAGVNPVDSITVVLEKYCSKFDDIDVLFNVADVIFDNCFTVTTQPATVAEALQVLADQICILNTNGASLPTFDNIGSCLADTSSNDSLEDTILKIRDRLCQSPTWDASPLNWGCVEQPSDDTDLGTAIQNILTSLNGLVVLAPTYSADFVVTANAPSDNCMGITVSLATPINQDRFVAATAGDASPGTLQSKLVGGTGITLDFTTPTQVTINGAAGTGDHKVLADVIDTSADYLINKLNGNSQYGVSITPSYNSGSEQVDLLLSIDPETLFDILLDQLTPGSDLYVKFCEKVAGCPSPCDAPTNVQAIAGTIPTTSTTTLP